MIDVRLWRLMLRLQRFPDVPVLGWLAGRLASHIWCHLYYRRGWRPVDLRNGYVVPDHKLKRWTPPVDPRVARNLGEQPFSPFPSQTGPIDCRCHPPEDS